MELLIKALVWVGVGALAEEVPIGMGDSVTCLCHHLCLLNLLESGFIHQLPPDDRLLLPMPSLGTVFDVLPKQLLFIMGSMGHIII